MPAADWANVATGINQSIEAALTRYQHGEASDAILDIQDTYFNRFEASGMENKIGSAMPHLKPVLRPTSPVWSA